MEERREASEATLWRLLLWRWEGLQGVCRGDAETESCGRRDDELVGRRPSGENEEEEEKKNKKEMHIWKVNAAGN